MNVIHTMYFVMGSPFRLLLKTQIRIIFVSFFCLIILFVPNVRADEIMAQQPVLPAQQNTPAYVGGTISKAQPYVGGTISKAQPYVGGTISKAQPYVGGTISKAQPYVGGTISKAQPYVGGTISKAQPYVGGTISKAQPYVGGTISKAQPLLPRVGSPAQYNSPMQSGYSNMHPLLPTLAQPNSPAQRGYAADPNYGGVAGGTYGQSGQVNSGSQPLEGSMGYSVPEQGNNNGMQQPGMSGESGYSSAGSAAQ